MRIETAEAFARLVAIFGTALGKCGERLPEDISSLVLEDPIETCEQLNARALACNAIDDEIDAALAAVYESLNARDARSEMDTLTRSRLTRELEQAIRVSEAAYEDAMAKAREQEERERLEAEARAAREAQEAAARAEQEANFEAALPTDSLDGIFATDYAEKQGVAYEQPSRENAAPKGKKNGRNGADADRPKRRRGRKPKAKQLKEAPAPGGMLVSEESALYPEKPSFEESSASKERGSRAEQASLFSHEAPREHNLAFSYAAPTVSAAPTASVAKASSQERAPQTKAASGEGEFFTVDQAAAVLGINKQEVYRAIKKGSLTAHKQGRSWQISAQDVFALKG